MSYWHLTFAGLPSQIKLKAILLISFAKCLGMERTDALYISLDKPKGLTIFILPSRVSFLRLQPLRVFSSLFIFSSKCSLFACSVLYEKYMPRTQMGSFGLLKLKGMCVSSLQRPSHIASVLEVLISSPDIDLNSSSSLKSCSTDSSSLRNTVLSSAYCVIFISFVSTLIPLLDWSFLRALARSSIPIINSRPDKGQPCLTPRCRRKKEQACRLFITQIEASLYKTSIQFKRLGPKLNAFRAAFKYSHSIESKAFPVASLNYAFNSGTLSIIQRRWIISLIPKKDKDTSLLENVRPIWLLNVDYKILTKVISKRLEKLLPKIINPDQTGYVKGRYIGENVRLIQDIMFYTKRMNSPGIAIFLDFRSFQYTAPAKRICKTREDNR